MERTRAVGVLDYAAHEYLERGFSVIPISPKTKKAMVRWRRFQTELPTEADVESWQCLAEREGIPPDEVKLALITGTLSGIVVVDCDNQEAIDFCLRCGVWSPIRAKTKNGMHLFFRHPGGQEFRPRAGSNSRGHDWPKFDGLDFRGDGSYAVIAPSRGYEWIFDTDVGLDELDEWPVWEGWPLDSTPREYLGAASAPLPLGLSSDGPIDLTGVDVIDYRSEWERTSQYVAENYSATLKIPTGQGNYRNQRVLMYASEQVRAGYWGEKLDERVLHFMDTFFVDRLEDEEWRATCRSVEDMERRNHPERFDECGNYIPHRNPATAAMEEPPREPEQEDDLDLHTLSEVSDLLADYEPEFLVEPIIPKDNIVHISGYTGQGKSTLVQLITHATAAGRRRVGPFRVMRRFRTLYLNYEEGKRTIRNRIHDNSELIGPLRPTHVENVVTYNASMSRHVPMTLDSKENRKRLYRMIMKVRPDLIVIDTIRSAFPTLDENDASQWKPLNQFFIKLRNKGISIILLHHRNKPGDRGLGSYAGSTSQLDAVETQLYTALLYEDEDVAREKGGVHDARSEELPSIHDRIYNELPGGRIDWKVTMLMRVSMGKTRDEDELMEKHYYIARIIELSTGKQSLFSFKTIYDRFVDMYLKNMSVPQIAAALGKSIRTIEEWVERYEKRP